MATAIEFSPTDVQSLCQSYLKDNLHAPMNGEEGNNNSNFHIIKYKLKPISDSPSGFLGHHRYLTVDLQLQEQNNETGSKDSILNRIRFFTKSAPVEIASRMEYLEEFGVFHKEIIVYRDVLPQLQQIYTDVAPKCYYADNNLLVFEDLQQSNYKMAAGRDGLLDYEHLNCAVKTLAALHAASIVFEFKEQRRVSEIFPKATEENAYPFNCQPTHVRYQNFANGVKVFKELIKQIPKYKDNLDFILETLQEKMSTIFRLAQPAATRLNVFSHGDLWANNVMFAYGKYGEIPIQSRFVDFQLARYAPPMLDLITLLTIPTTRAFRSKYLIDLIQDYYGFIREFLKREHLNVENFLPTTEFWETFEEFRICGLIESCLFSHMTILPPALTQNLTSSADGFSNFFERKRSEICLEAFRSDEIYRERLSDMLEDLVDNYMLKDRK